MMSRPRNRLFFTARWGPIALVAVASGCVPDVPVATDAPDGGAPTGLESDQDGIIKAPSAGAGGAGVKGSSATDPASPDAEGQAADGSAAPMSMDPDAPVADGDDPAGMEAVMTPYLCSADSDCAESLVCQDEECVFVPPERFPSTTVQTAGGGLLTGAGLRLQVRVGAPSPVGRMGAAGHHLTLGPLAGH